MNKSQKLETLANRTVLWEKETYRGQKKIHLISTLPINRGTSTLHALGSVISVSSLYSMDCGGLNVDFAKSLSNDFNRLEGKCANRRYTIQVFLISPCRFIKDG
jgi:hypothetical protein